MKKFSVVSIAVGLALGIAPAAFAQNAYVEGSSGTSAGVGSGADVGVVGDVNVGATGTGMVKEGAEGGADTSGSAGIGATIVVTRGSAGEASATISSSAAVQTSADLSAYASAVVKADENVEGAELSANKVSVHYKERAKLFGFIPIFVTATATVHKDGSVSVSYPWYGFLLSQGERVELESDVEAALQADAEVAAALEAAAEFSARTQAVLLETVHAAMKSGLAASLSAEAVANAGASAN
ncbi:hypothetical protein A3C21_02715 [Candidatus Kaiserbacteria bacterium RIFCSPHIGHO2_02_FULL_59_21]|uniref:LPXTG-motif cell wall anchor domain protein n=2 Tax=Candidatus Kaiseribacteriota TaxID=1752734 RepID=A0A0G2AVC2_9BACT|nr:MAG: LPXTG-motif cell wall anchor domain protein [Candidatus Kaiserbacteria bacterium GW2011_GWA2_58_9]OGG63028.1 MAG: hypothetical protein A2766_00040 [Candidatus Kaiserbacteria bacterium RIFCSPHIGHO2_01_FULL_58_22]OGG67022.1 MAG: hypothetical protein A3C21_02715 [Candidatus Kaiserbacteria bacterium RIFCSPHIGHO2_02_FULL_59_21]OGG79553.1 MAG: hypothetical protein A2952_00575 [Candidatus Kaiserbacteria bacterium RIFCSPLOWO2_01_FULL_59_34]OGG86736.1 MAG: hypothetical protein A3I47_03615 [Candi